MNIKIISCCLISAALLLSPVDGFAQDDEVADDAAVSISGDVETDSSEARKVYGLVLFEIGAGKLDETHFGRQSLTELRAGGGLLLPVGFSVDATYRARFYEKGYISSVSNTVDGEDPQLMMKEKFHDAVLSVSWNALHSVTEMVDLELTLGPRFAAFNNKAFGVWSTGILVGAGTVVRPSENFHLLAEGAWTAGFAGEEKTLSLMGLPKHFWDVSGGFGFDFHASSKWSLELRWHGSWIVFEKSIRDYQSALVGLSVEI